MLDLRKASYTRQVLPEDLQSVGFDTLLHGNDLPEDRAGTTARAPGDAMLVQLHLDEDEVVATGATESRVSLYEAIELANLLEDFPGRIALDITGIEHKVWAPLIRTALECGRDLAVLYAEPDDYQRATEPLPGAIHDLSERIRGIEPLPGFARVAQRQDDRGYFAPLLGFEGARLAYVFDRQEVDVRRTYPVVGLPGFRIEYPTYTYLGNREQLEADQLHTRVEMARANCPFEAFQALRRIHVRAGGSYLRIAPIGTKPHALGAVLYAIANDDAVELVYDHPVRTISRTTGVRLVNVFEVSEFMKDQIHG